MDLKKIGAICLSLRYWSLPASSVPVSVAAMVLVLVDGVTFSALHFLLCMCGVLAAHCAGNLANTYYDFKSGCDTQHHADDRTLVDGLLLPAEVKNLTILFLVLGLSTGGYFIAIRGTACALVVLVGLLLCLGYSATPTNLKHKGLGDVVIFLCFGPVLTAGVTIALVGEVFISTILFCLPAAFITMAILHANNTRDIEADKRVGGVTVASMLGVPSSFLLYKLLLALPYAVCALLAMVYGKPLLLLVFLSLFISLDLLRDFQDYRDGRRPGAVCMRLSPQKTAQFGLWFGVLMMGGLLRPQPLSRALLGALFALGGGNNLYNFPVQSKLVYYKINCVVEVAADRLLPKLATDAMLLGATFAQIIGALGFIAGFYPRECACVLLFFLVMVTPVVHNFWVYDPHPELDPLRAKKEAKGEAKEEAQEASEGVKKDAQKTAAAVLFDRDRQVPVFQTTFDAEFVQFWKNIGMAGGLFVFIVYSN